MKDLFLAEFAKQLRPSKYYTDKKRAVMFSWLHLKHHIQSGQLDIEDAKRLPIPFVLCEGLEADIYQLQLFKEMRALSSILEIKGGGIQEFLGALSQFKNNCIDVTEITSCKPEFLGAEQSPKKREIQSGKQQKFLIPSLENQNQKTPQLGFI
ncbi:uncharacterized protein EV154DRAFT_484395 [Mucor mucedo]|uniref:uncharacterized protein n=1 Tax=Mucor mucedo TaxID=29922 RepID=UPI0022208396|nr:uncharacterized protein EV154DRAFT_484395 [Mucor mucedo]KAI7888075.1 hypothetical protein EV154DRAFT_484395 [Mucor mucedo]